MWKRMHSDRVFSVEDVMLNGSITGALEMIIGEYSRPIGARANDKLAY